MLLLSSLILTTILGVNGKCSMANKQKIDGVCIAEITCYGTTGDMMNIVNNWDCIRNRHNHRYYQNHQYYYEQDSNFNLYLNVRDVDIGISEDPLIAILDVSTKVIDLNIEKGNLVSVPIQIGVLNKLTKLSLTYNEIETLNLRKVTAGVAIEYLNVSHNSITTIEEDLLKSTEPSLINTVDLSYNELRSIPDNCFARFSQLKYLDLSYNFLKQFDILTFEGITQLEILELSNNIISEIGQTFARFRKLKKLTLNNNQLTFITYLNFKNQINLEKLNLSSNFIENIENRSLATLENLKELDLSHNKINVIHRTLFENNVNIFILSLFHNEIEHIEEGAFRTTNISYLDVQNNHISGSIEYDTFEGISVETLDLSNEKISKLGDKAFSSLSNNLKYLNMSTNSIENITESAFQSLQKLLILDLSYNDLIDIDFNTSDLIELTEYYLQNNKIKNVAPNMFRNMTKLVKLDMSQNKIVDIELNSFIDLIHLKELNLRNNILVNSLIANLFRGLHEVEILYLSNTRLMSYLNESFSGMVSLSYLNTSHNQLETIEYDTFKITGTIKIIDLSYNVLEYFHINTSSISQLSELYLNHNKLKNITSETFKNLYLLKKLDLASNNIFYIDSSSFKTVSHLQNLDLFSNLNMRFKSDVFNNLVLSEVSLRRVRQYNSIKVQFNFENAVNTSITTLILSHCEIADINSVFVYNIKNILKLDISSNKIEALDKGSFQNMTTLNWLDISYNMISTIQPGTFLSNNMVNTLNLYGNNIQSLQFGVLDGLRNLRVLNLSNNEIHTFGVNLLHSSPHLTELLLENNNLVSIDFDELSGTSVELITIGGNSISCDSLLDWNKKNDDNNLNVTAEKFDFNSENIYGVSCKTRFSREKTKNENSTANITSEVIEIKETVEQLYSYLRISLNETFTKIIAFLKNSDYSDKVSVNLNQSQLVLSEQLKDLINENKHLLPQLVNTSDNVENDIKLMISLLKMNNNLTKLGNIQKKLLQSKLQTRLSNNIVPKQENSNSTVIVPKLYDAEPLEVKLDNSTLADIKVLLYFIAACLAVVILFCIVVLTYKYLYRQVSRRIRVNNLCDSGQSVSNGLEME